ncbi:MAG: glycosyltransferase family 2 protein [Lewinellaceae bacterium]|nr:glycosyltransferase family 2 protein [Saprospiraceae bacterium]MCB9356141.1 glycosyltransferase family 2 protein [Lewinellaceae bacterium]
MTELVSCVVPTYNRAAFLKDAIESTLAQDYPNWELIIVDDQSADNTAEVAKAYAEKDPRIRYFLNPQKGVSSARNYGIEMAKGQYIAFLDDDDISLPHRFGSQLKAMLKSNNGFLVSGFQSKDRDTGEVLSEYKLELKATCSGFPSRWMIRKDLLEKVGGFDQAAAPLEDIELSSRLARLETFAQHDDIVAVTFPTEGSASSATEKKVKARLVLLERSQQVFSPLEAAWWQFSAATDYYMLGETDKAMEFLKMAALGDNRGIYGLAYRYFMFAKTFGGILKKVNLKVLSTLREYKLPVLVEHPVVSNV